MKLCHFSIGITYLVLLCVYFVGYPLYNRSPYSFTGHTSNAPQEPKAHKNNAQRMTKSSILDILCWFRFKIDRKQHDRMHICSRFRLFSGLLLFLMLLLYVLLLFVQFSAHSFE